MNEVEKQLGSSIKSLRSNRGGEYLSQAFLDYLRDNGILSNGLDLTHHNTMVWLREGTEPC